MEDIEKGYCFADLSGSKFLVVSNAKLAENNKDVYICQEITGDYRLMVWTKDEIYRCISGVDIDDNISKADTIEDKSLTNNSDNIIFNEDKSFVSDEKGDCYNDFIDFFETDSCKEKIEIFEKLKGKATESMLDSIAISLDFETGDTSIEEKYYAINRFLKTKCRYEGTRR